MTCFYDHIRNVCVCIDNSEIVVASIDFVYKYISWRGKMKKIFFSLTTFLVLATTYNFNEVQPKIQYIEITEDDIAQFFIEEEN